MAYHDPKGPREPRQAKPRHILRAIRQRCAHRLCYEHAKSVHSTRTEPKTGPRQGAWYAFHKHWLATGVASMAKGGRPRLHLLTSAPPASPAAPGSTHLRVGVALTPARGKRPTASAWALEAHDNLPPTGVYVRLATRADDVAKFQFGRGNLPSVEQLRRPAHLVRVVR